MGNIFHLFIQEKDSHLKSVVKARHHYQSYKISDLRSRLTWRIHILAHTSLPQSSLAEYHELCNLPRCCLVYKATFRLPSLYFNFLLWVDYWETSCLPSDFAANPCTLAYNNFPFCIESGPPDIFLYKNI